MHRNQFLFPEFEPPERCRQPEWTVAAAAFVVVLAALLLLRLLLR